MNMLHRPAKFDLALRVALLLIFVFAVEWPGEPLVTLGPQQTVITNNPKAGVHTRLTDEGATVEDSAQPAAGARDGRAVDRRILSVGVHRVRPEHFRLVAHRSSDRSRPRAGLDSHRAPGVGARRGRGLIRCEQETTFNYIDPDHYDDFGDFVYAFVDRYKDRVDHIIIWNEPNLSFEWGLRPVDAQAYVDLLKVAYRRAKEANPNVVVLAGALAPTLEPAGSSGGLERSDLLAADV